MLVATSAAGFWYLAKPMAAYSDGFIGYTRDSGGVWLLGAGVVVAIACRLLARSTTWSARVRHTIPATLAIVVLLLAAYAYFFREPERTDGCLRRLRNANVRVVRDADWSGGGGARLGGPRSTLVLAGSGLLSHRDDVQRLLLLQDEDRARALLEHAPVSGLRASRADARSAAASCTPSHARPVPWRRLLAGAVAAALVLFASRLSFWRAAAPVRAHVEYAGLIPKLESLAGRFADDDLVDRRVEERVGHARAARCRSPTSTLATSSCSTHRGHPSARSRTSSRGRSRSTRTCSFSEAEERIC